MKLSLIGFLATTGSAVAFQQMSRHPVRVVGSSNRRDMKLRTIAMDPSTAEGVLPNLNNNDQKDNKNAGAMMDLSGVVFSVSKQTMYLLEFLKQLLNTFIGNKVEFLAKLSILRFGCRLDEILGVVFVHSV